MWLRLSQAADWISGGHPTVAALLLRLPALAGLLLCAWALGEIATRLRLRGRLGQALWLGVASPLTVVLGVGGGHNDLIMMGLAFAGLALASKYTAVLFGVGVVLWLLLEAQARRWFARWHLWAGGAVALLTFAPVIAWNAAHDWASFAKQGGRAGSGGGSSRGSAGP